MEQARNHRQRKRMMSLRPYRRSSTSSESLLCAPLAALSLDEILALHLPRHGQHLHNIHPFRRRNDDRRRKICPSDACYHRDDRFHRP